GAGTGESAGDAARQSPSCRGQGSGAGGASGAQASAGDTKPDLPVEGGRQDVAGDRGRIEPARRSQPPRYSVVCQQRQQPAEGDPMSAVTLKRTDPERNVCRFYLLAVQPELFGDWSLVREWGRIGRAGQVRIISYPTQAEAEAAFRQHRRRKERKGYR